jgi:hypothetical protein
MIQQFSLTIELIKTPNKRFPCVLFISYLPLILSVA